MSEHLCVWKTFLLPELKGKALSALLTFKLRASRGRQAALARWVRPHAKKKNAVCKKSFSAAASTPAEEVSGAEAGRQGKVTSEIKELGEGNREVERKKKNKLPVKPFKGKQERTIWEEKGVKTREDPNCVTVGLHQPPTWCSPVWWLQRVQPC